MKDRDGPGALRLATAGIGVVGVSFGMARYGYGLLLPDFKRDYGLAPGVLGTIATGSYVVYLLATVVTGSVASRVGPRGMAVTSGLLAAFGMTVAGLSQTPAIFVAGILIAGASAALAFAPFSDAARDVRASARGRVLAAMNCGTGYGVALAVPIAILAGAAWRAAWLGFAVVALLATLWAAWVLRGASGEPRSRGVKASYGWSGVLCRRSRPLLAGGILVGLGSSAYWTFAVDHLVDAGALSATASRSFLAVVGVASVLATLTADLVRRLGPRPAFVVTTLAEGVAIALLATVPSSLLVALLSGVLFGAAYNAAVGIQAIWSSRVFEDRPSLGIAATFGSNGLGLMLGPLGAGLLAERIGLGAVLLLGAAVVAAAGLLAPREAILPVEEREGDSPAQQAAPA